MQFQGNIGILVFGRKILKKNPKVSLQFFIEDRSGDSSDFNKDLWEKSFAEILENFTKFGRIGVFIDRKNFEAQSFFKKLDIPKFKYTKQDRRSESIPQILIYQIQVLKHMAEEGLADCIEFRRLARKFIRRAKNNNCDTLFFPENIFGEEKTKQILQQIAGTQLKVFTPYDFFDEEIKPSEKQKIEIFYKNEDPVFLKKRAEKILKTKLSDKSLRRHPDVDRDLAINKDL